MYRRLSNGAEKNHRYDQVSALLATITPVKNVSVVNAENKKIPLTSDWQGRIIYPEQLLAVEKFWVVDNFFNAIDVRVISNIKLYVYAVGVGERALIEVEPEQYKDKGEDDFAFICDHAEMYYKYYMQTLKIGPVKNQTLLHPTHNSCSFYLEDVAYLYADSLQAQLRNKEI
jgi:hypothetical protein